MAENRFDGMSEEEKEELGEELLSELDSFIEFLNECEKETTFMLNPHRVEQMEFSYKMLLKSIAGVNKNVSISHFMSDVNKTVAVIRLEGKNIDAIDIERFSRACEFADATDIYPLARGVVRIEFTFRKIFEAR